MQDNEETVVTVVVTVMTPPVAEEILMPVPLELAATGFDIATDVVDAVGAKVTFTYAATPEVIVLVFSPVTRHVDEPEA